MEDKKDALGLYTSENEGTKLWPQTLTQLHQRGVQDILISCIENLKGFAEAIETVCPRPKFSCVGASDPQLAQVRGLETSKGIYA